jgi:Ca2+-binding RTX toxin-like protein
MTMPTVTIKKNVMENYVVDASDTKYVLNKGIEIHGSTRGIEEGVSFGNNTFLLDGKVSASDDNATAILSHGADSEFRIGESGRIKGDYGVYTDGAGALVINDGRIDAKEVAAEIEGAGAKLVNHGTITSQDGYAFLAVAATGFTLENDGEIISKLGMRFDGDDLTLKFGADSVIKTKNEVIELNSDMGDTSLLVNKGLIEATDKHTFLIAITADEANDTVRNFGKIKGDVTLGSGQDTFDDRGGRVVRGAVYGGDDGDTYFLSSNHTRVYEQSNNGYDRLTVKFSYTLEDSCSMEEVMLAGKGDLKLVANNLGLYLGGNAGDNKLIGGTGDDAFWGGHGNDIMKGGEGEDAFYFKPHSDREIVMDFVDGVDHIVFQAGDEVTSYDDLLANHMKDVDGGMLIYGDGTKLFLKGMDTAHFDVNDFIS